jgi:hypothetical protein
MSSVSQDVIKLQLADLVVSHKYKVSFNIANKDILSIDPILDINEFTFTASSSVQNVFILVTKALIDPLVLLEVKTQDLTDHRLAYTSMLIECPQYDACLPRPSMTPTVTPTQTATPTPTPTITPTTSQ